MTRFIQAFLPNHSAEELRAPEISPLYADFKNLKLPRAIFLCGTEDALLDDSLFMSAKWAATSEAGSILKIYPGAAHGFVGFDPKISEGTKEALDDIQAFVKN
jgi:acetyl esterase/lipase